MECFSLRNLCLAVVQPSNANQFLLTITQSVASADVADKILVARRQVVEDPIASVRAASQLREVTAVSP